MSYSQKWGWGSENTQSAERGTRGAHRGRSAQKSSSTCRVGPVLRVALALPGKDKTAASEGSPATDAELEKEGREDMKVGDKKVA